VPWVLSCTLFPAHRIPKDALSEKLANDELGDDEKEVKYTSIW